MQQRILTWTRRVTIQSGAPQLFHSRHFSIPFQPLSTTSTAFKEEVEEEEIEVRDIFEKVEGFKLRPYQIDCVNSCLSSIHSGITRIGVSAPTGSGKTSIFTSLIEKLPKLQNPAGTIGSQVLVLVGAIELLKQAADNIKKRCPELSVEIEGGKSVATGKADVTIATYQTLSRGDRLIQKFNPRDFKAVIVDEAHHAAAKSYLDILAHFDSRILSTPITPDSILKNAVISNKNEEITIEEVQFPSTILSTLDENLRVCVPILGFTATFFRTDQLALGTVFQAIVWHSDWIDMISGSYLSPVQFTTVHLGEELDLSGVGSSSKDFTKPELSKRVDTRKINSVIVDSWCEKAGDRKSTLIFAVDIKHVVNLTNCFRAEGIDARSLHSKIPDAERLRLLDEFKQGIFLVLINCSILTEGADIPCIDCIILARPTKSQNLFIQMLGRGLRLHPGKIDCLVIDLVGNVNHGIFSTATLFGIDPSMTIENQSTSSLKQLSIESKAPLEELSEEPGIRSVTYKDFGSIWNLLSSQKKEERPLSLKERSRFAWVGIGDAYLLSNIKTKGHIKIQEVVGSLEPIYEATLVNRKSFGDKQFTIPTLLFQHFDLQRLFQLVDAYATKVGSDFTERGAWQYRPASDAQIDFIRRKLFTKKRETIEFDPSGQVTVLETEEDHSNLIDGAWIGKELGTQVLINDLTRGEAAEAATRIIHGGKTFLARLKKDLAREKRSRKKRN